MRHIFAPFGPVEVKRNVLEALLSPKELGFVVNEVPNNEKDLELKSKQFSDGLPLFREC